MKKTNNNYEKIYCRFTKNIFNCIQMYMFCDFCVNIIIKNLHFLVIY